MAAPTVDLDNIFTYHKPFGDQPVRFTAIRDNARELAKLIVSMTPPSREQSLALTNIQQAVMWANAAIAINEKEPVTDPAAILAGDPDKPLRVVELAPTEGQAKVSSDPPVAKSDR